MKNLDLDNNWVVLDPQRDAYEITDAIGGEKNEQIEEVKLEEPEEIDTPNGSKEDIDPDFKIFLEEERERMEQLQQNEDDLLQQFLASEFKCLICGEGKHPDRLLELQCGHSFCVTCCCTYARDSLKDPTVLEIPCAHSQCAVCVPQWALRRALPEDEFDKYDSRALKMMIDNCEDMFVCPNESCEFVVERIHAPMPSKPVTVSILLLLYTVII